MVTLAFSLARTPTLLSASRPVVYSASASSPRRLPPVTGYGNAKFATAAVAAAPAFPIHPVPVPAPVPPMTRLDDGAGNGHGGGRQSNGRGGGGRRDDGASGNGAHGGSFIFGSAALFLIRSISTAIAFGHALCRLLGNLFFSGYDSTYSSSSSAGFDYYLIAVVAICLCMMTAVVTAVAVPLLFICAMIAKVFGAPKLGELAEVAEEVAGDVAGELFE